MKATTTSICAHITVECFAKMYSNIPNSECPVLFKNSNFSFKRINCTFKKHEYCRFLAKSPLKTRIPLLPAHSTVKGTNTAQCRGTEYVSILVRVQHQWKPTASIDGSDFLNHWIHQIVHRATTEKETFQKFLPCEKERIYPMLWDEFDAMRTTQAKQCVLSWWRLFPSRRRAGWPFAFLVLLGLLRS